MKNKPNLFIVGAPKAGTTFLYEFLSKQQKVFLPKIKELNHFTYDELSKESYYNDFKVKDLKSYLKYFKKVNGEKYIIDSSVSYFASPRAASRIKAFNSEAKIIIILRDPIQRAYSHYLMDLRMSFARKPMENYLSDASSFHYKQYIHNSNYILNCSKFLEVFGEENVLILSLSHLSQSIEKLAKYLDLKVDFSTEEINKKVNEKQESKNKAGDFILKNRGFTERAKLLIPNFLKNKIKKIIYKDATDESIDLKLKTLLENKLGEDLKFYKKIKDENSFS